MKDLLSNCKIVEVAEAQDSSATISEDIDIEGFGAAMVLVSTDNAALETTVTIGEDADGVDIEETITGSGVLQISDFPGLVRAESTEISVDVDLTTDSYCCFVLLTEARYAPVLAADHIWA